MPADGGRAGLAAAGIGTQGPAVINSRVVAEGDAPEQQRDSRIIGVELFGLDTSAGEADIRGSHPVLREGAGFVSADNCGAAQGLHSMKTAY